MTFIHQDLWYGKLVPKLMLSATTCAWSLVHQTYWKCPNIKTLKQFQNGLLPLLIFDIMNYLWTELQAPVVQRTTTPYIPNITSRTVHTNRREDAGWYIRNVWDNDGLGFTLQSTTDTVTVLLTLNM